MERLVLKQSLKSKLEGGAYSEENQMDLDVLESFRQLQIINIPVV